MRISFNNFKKIKANLIVGENFKYGFDDTFIQKLIERMEQHQDIFNKILYDKDFGIVVKA